MPRMRYPGFCGPSYTAQSPISDVEKCFNLFPESNKAPNATSPWSLVPTPGQNLLSTASTTGGRGIFSVNSRGYCVIGNTFYEVKGDFSLTNRGTVAVNSNPSTICSNLEGQIFITSGGNGYLFDTVTNVFTVIANLVGKADQGDHLDGFFLALQFSTSIVYISGADDGLTWDLTQFFQRSAFPDPWRAIKVTPAGQILLLGEETSELWGDVGSSPIPFAPIGGAKFKQGIAAPFSCRAAGSNMIWLAQNEDGQRTLQRLGGYSATQVSTPPIDWALRQYQKVSDAECFVYDLEGHIHYCLNVPSANASWGFDNSENLFHERGTWNTASASFDVWHPQDHAMMFGKHVVTDRFTGNIYELGTDFGYDAGGAYIRRMRIPPAMSNMKRMMYYSDLEVLLESGLAPLSGDGSNATMWLEQSKNGGKTWGHRRGRSVGVSGDYGHRTRWGTLTAARHRADRLTMADPVPWRITDAFITAEQGTN